MNTSDFLTTADATPATAPELEEQRSVPFKLEVWRFFVALGVFLVIFGNNILFGTFGAVTPTTALRYGTDSWAINMLNLINCAAYFPSIWPTTWLLDTHGLRPGMIVAALGTFVGGLLRWLSFLGPTSSAKIAMLGVGSFICGFFGLLCQDGSTKAAAHWFSGEGRLTANAVMSIATPLGVAVGQFLGPLIVNGDPNNVDLLNFIMFVLSSVCCLGAFLVFNNPASPPSASAKQGTLEYREGLRKIFGNGHFWIAVLVGGTAIATTGTMSTYASNYVTPYGYTEDVAGNSAIAMFIGGIVTAMVISRILDKTKAHIPAMKILSAFLLVSLVVFYVAVVVLKQDWLVYISCALCGMGSFPNLAIALELCAESTYPIAEATSSGVLLVVTQVLTILTLFLTNALSEPDGKMWKSIIMLIVVNVITVIAAMFYNTPNRRIELEKRYEIETK
ncbi:major facilitator superfamily domain-containing protein [Obelidium mucronatum]|nr:major facilitator superfamily domain-containing protein [Obelidium mucronatum]